MTESRYNFSFNILISPRKTISKIISKYSEWSLVILASLVGYGTALSNAFQRGKDIGLSLSSSFLIAIPFGIIIGLIFLYVGAFFIRITGSWLGGKASWREVKFSFAWSQLPLALILPLWIPKTFIYGKTLFTQEKTTLVLSDFSNLVMGIIFVIEILALISFVIILVECLAELQKFSRAKAVGNIAFSIFLGLVSVPIILFLIIIITKFFS